MHADAEGAPATVPLTMPTVDRVRAHYMALCSIAPSLAGLLLLVDGLRDEGDALLLAASIAGAASLVLENALDAVRYCVRNGIVDFAVTTLDEALRILKNEVRKQQPIAVLLEQEPAIVLSEMVERGAQPDLLRWTADGPALKPALQTLRERGAQPLPPAKASKPATEATERLEVIWRAGEGGSAALRQVDLLVAQLLPSDDLERQNWIARAPRYLPRALRLARCVPMSQAESRTLIDALNERAEQKTLASPIEIDIEGEKHAFSPLV